MDTPLDYNDQLVRMHGSPDAETEFSVAEMVYESPGGGGRKVVSLPDWLADELASRAQAAGVPIWRLIADAAQVKIPEK